MARKRIAFVDSTLRDGQETLLGGRLRVELVAPLLETLDEVGFHAIEAWGGGTFLTSLSLLHEDPWERLRVLRTGLKRTPIQMLLRGRFLVGDRSFSYGFVQRFLKRSHELGVGVVRLYDPMNDLASLSRVAKIASRIGLTAQGSVLCSAWAKLNYHRDLIRRTDLSNFDSLGLFDPIGTLSAVNAGKLTELIHNANGNGVSVHLHNLDGIGVSAVMKAKERGAWVIDSCFSAFTCEGSLPSIEALLRNFDENGSSKDLNLRALLKISKSLWHLRREYFDRVPSIMRPTTALEKTMQEMKPTSLSLMGIRLRERIPRDEKVRRETYTIINDLGLVTLVEPLTRILARQVVLNLHSRNRYERMTDEFLRLLRGEYGSVKAPAYLSSRINDSPEKGEAEERSVMPPDRGKMSRDDLLNFELFPEEWRRMRKIKGRDSPWQREGVVAAALTLLAEEAFDEEPVEREPDQVQAFAKSLRWRNASRLDEASSLKRRGFIEEPF